MYVVYVIQNEKTKEVYIGVTSNLKQRLEQHNSHSKGFTKRKSKSKWILVYAEAFRDKNDAFCREFKLKQRGSARYGLMKRISRSLLK